MALTSAQQAVIDTLTGGGNVSAEEVHPATLKSLENAGLVEVSDGAVFLTDWVESEEVAIEVEPEHATADEIMIERVVILREPVRIMISPDGKTALVPAGAELPLLSYHEEATRSRVLKWFNVVHPSTGTPFLVNSIRNEMKIIEPRKLSSF